MSCPLVPHVNQRSEAEAFLWNANHCLASLLERLHLLENFMDLAWELEPLDIHEWAHDLGEILSQCEEELAPFFEDSSHNSFVVDPHLFSRSRAAQGTHA